MPNNNSNGLAWLGVFLFFLFCYYAALFIQYVKNLILDYPVASLFLIAAILFLVYKKRRKLKFWVHKSLLLLKQALTKATASHSKAPPKYWGNRYVQQVNAITDMSVIRKKPIFNDGEREVFHTLRKTIKEFKAYDLFLHGQVSLGEIFYVPDTKDYLVINSKRVDFLITDSYGRAKLAIEQRGDGSISNEDDRLRNEVKRIAFQKAGIDYIDVYGEQDAEKQLRRWLLHNLPAKNI